MPRFEGSDLERAVRRVIADGTDLEDVRAMLSEAQCMTEDYGTYKDPAAVAREDLLPMTEELAALGDRLGAPGLGSLTADVTVGLDDWELILDRLTGPDAAEVVVNYVVEVQPSGSTAWMTLVNGGDSEPQGRSAYRQWLASRGGMMMRLVKRTAVIRDEVLDSGTQRGAS